MSRLILNDARASLIDLYGNDIKFFDTPDMNDELETMLHKAATQFLMRHSATESSVIMYIEAIEFDEAAREFVNIPIALKAFDAKPFLDMIDFEELDEPNGDYSDVNPALKNRIIELANGYHVADIPNFGYVGYLSPSDYEKYYNVRKERHERGDDD